MSNEPSIAPGDWHEHVTLLQQRLHQLGYYEGSMDGHYGPATETAVQQLQEAAGIEQDAHVQEATWEALERQESLHASAYPATDEATSAGPQLSEDGKWWWDGTDWKSMDDQETTDEAEPSQVELQLSPDGNYQWDGTQWLPIGDATAMVDFALDGQVGDAGLPQPQAGPFGTADQSDHPGLKSASTAAALTGFETGLADLLPEHMEILDGIAADLNAHPLGGGFVTLTGTADRRGDPDSNKALGQQRADVVRDYLVQRIDDEETRQAIRAYSLGALDDGPQGDQPDLRRVDIAITRRTVQMPTPHPTDTLPQGPSYKLPEEGTLPSGDPWPKPPFPWMRVPQRPPSPDFITQLNEWIDRRVLNTDDLERLGGDIASVFGQDRATVRGKLDEAFRSGKQAAVKAILKAIVDWTAGALSTPPPGPPQGPPDPIPFPTPQVQGPEIRF